jgi:membrane fusion protein (multidrug efflux system)
MIKPLIAVALGLSLLATEAVAQDKEAEKSVLVTTVAAQRGTLPETLTSYGTAEPQPGSVSNISLPRAGQILQIVARPGQKLRQGEALLSFGADAAVVMAWNQAVAALELAREERAHVEQLLKQQLATRSQLAQAEKAVRDAEAALEAQRREGGGQPVETVTAPFDGIVMTIPVNTGDRIQAGASLATLLRADAVSVTIGVEPSERGKLKPGAPVSLEPLDGGAAVAGTIATVGAMLDPRSRKIEAIVTVPRDGVLPGAAFRAIVTIGELTGWIVPRAAVLNDGKTDRVFQLADGKAVAIPVRIVGSNGDSTVVEGNLDPSRPLITDGAYQLSDGMAVRTAPDEPDVKESGAKKSDAKKSDGSKS